MHDPMVVAFEIRRPWPSRRATPVRPGQPRWEWKCHGRWWKPGNWSPFVTAFGRRWFFPSLLTVWHVEPRGADSGTVCRHTRRVDDVAGWKVRLHPLLRLVPAAISGTARRSGGGSGRRDCYHRECSGLISMRRTREHDEALIRSLVSALRVATDEDEAQLLERLTDPKSRGLDFHLAYRLTGVLGYERDGAYRLVKKPEPPNRVRTTVPSGGVDG